MSSKITLFLTTLIYARPNLASELCRGGNGYMSMSNKTRIVSNFTNENGNNKILVDKDSEFTYTCHNNQDAYNTKILFGSENPIDQPGNESPVSRVLKSSSLTENPMGTNTEPFSIKCEGVCQISFITVLFNAGSFCENNSTGLV